MVLMLNKGGVVRPLLFTAVVTRQQLVHAPLIRTSTLPTVIDTINILGTHHLRAVVVKLGRVHRRMVGEPASVIESTA